MKTYKAAVATAPGVLEIQERPVPLPGVGQYHDTDLRRSSNSGDPGRHGRGYLVTKAYVPGTQTVRVTSPSLSA